MIIPTEFLAVFFGAVIALLSWIGVELIALKVKVGEINQALNDCRENGFCPTGKKILTH